jgi:hypothetical protein
VTPRLPFAKTRPLRFAASLAAFLAVALLALAGVKSTVMQAQAAAPWDMASICQAQMPGMGDMAMGHTAMAGGQAHKSAPATCAFCDAAAHVPLQSVAAPIPAPIAVAWIAPTPVADHAPRGPPRLTPKARGPPAFLQTV